ncbi:exodeoxyribonuclease VII small subunit [Tumidithrix elongata RA019]|uniref:Exodeoxyribonuclease 7 small subunit n=1 Tax=Tumidithrix elongata BACA0141 TaxID=2716417 RepID=A0AAW9Q8B6_9CYAN|nr:exodeoxyribonuclease VII small subunit [Tumidithrix elongata RA019]
MPKSFEQQVQRLEEIVDLLDRGDVAIAEMLKLYQEGMNLAKQCRTYLETAEQKVTTISAQANIPETVPNSKVSFEQTAIDIDIEF